MGLPNSWMFYKGKSGKIPLKLMITRATPILYIYICMLYTLYIYICMLYTLYIYVYYIHYTYVQYIYRVVNPSTGNLRYNYDTIWFHGNP